MALRFDGDLEKDKGLFGEVKLLGRAEARGENGFGRPLIFAGAVRCGGGLDDPESVPRVKSASIVFLMIGSIHYCISFYFFFPT